VLGDEEDDAAVAVGGLVDPLRDPLSSARSSGWVLSMTPPAARTSTTVSAAPAAFTSVPATVAPSAANSWVCERSVIHERLARERGFTGNHAPSSRSSWTCCCVPFR
jgi:hypothetical protein